jgi:DNA repair protein RecO (recombination protein O)
MLWADEGVLLSVRSHGETAAIAEVFTRSHGRHLGLVHGGQSRRLRPTLQTGNQVDITWKARLSENLGSIGIELRRSFGAESMDDPARLSALTSLCALTRLLPEREPHANLYEVTLFVLGFLDDPSVWPALLVRWELALLDSLGYGLDLSRCADRGVNDDLAYVSPKSGRAVSRSSGEPYHDRMLALPQFLTGRGMPHVDNVEIAAGFALTGHFLMSRVLLPRGLELPEPRGRLLTLLANE